MQCSSLCKAEDVPSNFAEIIKAITSTGKTMTLGVDNINEAVAAAVAIRNFLDNDCSKSGHCKASCACDRCRSLRSMKDVITDLMHHSFLNANNFPIDGGE